MDRYFVAVPTRYQQLREAVANLAAPAEEQVRHLNLCFAPLTDRVAAYGNDELALEFEGIFDAANDMIEHAELTEEEREAIRPLDGLLKKWSGMGNADFWKRDALFSDARWTEVRACAAQALAQLPDEERAIGRSS